MKVLMADPDSRDVSELSAVLTTSSLPSSSANISDCSQRFAATWMKLFPGQVQVIHGNFMLHHPSILYVAWSRYQINSPWLYLASFGMCITAGQWLCDEENFAFYEARTKIWTQGTSRSPSIVLMIPHFLGRPGTCHPPPHDQTLASIANMDVPDVEIVTHHRRTWIEGCVDTQQWTSVQTDAFCRLDRSLAARKVYLME